jgi:translocation and assembly module TamB
LQGLPLAWLDQLGNSAMSRMGLSGDLLFGGQWQASSAESLQLRASFERSSGDLLLQTNDARGGSLRAGLKEAQLLVTAEGDRLTASLRWDSLHAGQAQADFSTRLLRQGDAWTWPQDAPLTGKLRAKLPPLVDWARLAPPGWRLRGTLEASADLSGTRGAPKWHGSVLGQELAVSSVADGIDFSKGTLRANIEGQRLEIVDFLIGGAGAKDPGLLSVKGMVEWLPPTGPTPAVSSRLRMVLDMQADSLRVSAAADRRLVLSGQLNARLANARLSVRGALKADQALFVLPEDTAPTLGDDVVVRSKNPAPTRSTQASMPAAGALLGLTPDILLSLDLGDRFRVRGQGLSTRLGGKIELHSGVDNAGVPRLTGELRTLSGSYKAYGQNLTIEEGVLRFDGAYDNPTLDILAIRPNLQQRVGVRISGKALSPVVQLYADPDLPEAEKLSWLVLGRSAANGGSEAALLQQAALSLLGDKGKGPSGGLARSLGFDELSIGSSANGSATGSNATDTTVTLGKHLARNFYVAYEHGLSSAVGTFYIFYELSRQFTVRAQTGEKSAVDLIFTLRYD